MTKKYCTSLKLMTIALLTCLLAACSSQPIIINHYLLNVSPSSSAAVINNDNDNDINVLITDILLPEHLANRSLVMQQQNGMLSIATKHVWAQPLDSDFGTLLANSISQKAGLNAFYGAHSASVMHSFVANSDVQLAIVIEHFMPIASGDVVLTGHWQLAFEEATEKPRRFEFRLPLEQDGYIHSVTKMRMLVQHLANAIHTELANNNALTQK